MKFQKKVKLDFFTHLDIEMPGLFEKYQIRKNLKKNNNLNSVVTSSDNLSMSNKEIAKIRHPSN